MVVVTGEFGQGIPESELPVVRVDQFDLEAHQFAGGRSEMQPIDVGGADDLGEFPEAEQDVGDAVRHIGLSVADPDEQCPADRGR